MKPNLLHKIRAAIEMASGLGIAAIAIVVVWRSFAAPSSASTLTPSTAAPTKNVLPSELIDLKGTFAKGSQQAKIAIVEYADFECPACQKFAQQTLPKLIATYVETGRARFVFKNFPLPNHALAEPAAVAAQCAGEQGKFWQFYELMFGRKSRLEESSILETAKVVGLDRARWDVCIKDTRSVELVQEHLDEARRLTLRGTPTFLVGTIDGEGRLRATSVMVGAQTVREFDTAITQIEKPNSAGK